MAKMSRFEAAAVLGIDESASLVEARKAFLSRVRLVHPDRFMDFPEGDRVAATKAMAQLNDAIDAFASQALVGEDPDEEDSDTRQRVRDDESPWTAEELRSVREALLNEVTELEQNIETAEAGLADLIRDSDDGARDDQADAGSNSFEREHEISLARNYRDSLDQVQRALARIEAKTYGMCETCGNPIGKFRLQAFPRATLCLLCKEAEESIQE
jgi:DnaK suppressor protein